MKLRSSLILILLLLAVSFVAAQEDYVVFEGDQTSFSVDLNPFSNYNWEVFTQLRPVVYATSGDYNFVSGNTSSETEILWKTAGRFFVLLTETDNSGCTNSKAIAVLVRSNNRSAGFVNTSGDACFDLSDNSFNLPLSVLNNSGLHLESENFPLQVEFKVNNIPRFVQLEYNSQFLHISDGWFNANPEFETIVNVEIISVADNKNIPIQISLANHTRTIFKIPEIEFASNQPDTIEVNSSYNFEIISNSGYTYEWWYTDSAGIQSNLNSNGSTVENFVWERAGLYKLFAQATDENGCKSEIISRTVAVSNPANILPQLVALPDFVVGYNTTTLIGNVSTNDILFPSSNPGLRYSLQGETIPGLTFNPDGSFVYNPVADFVGKIVFTYKVCFEDETPGCATSDVEIKVLSSVAEGNIAPIAATDVVLAFPDSIVISYLLTNDIDPDNSGELKINTTPVIFPVHGSVEIAPDGSFLYRPYSHFIGIDKFLYQVCDNGNPSLCDSAWVYIVVDNFGSSESRPVSTSDDVFLSGLEGIYSLTGNDFDLLGNSLSYNTIPAVSTQNGDLRIFENGTFRYTPNEGFGGVDWFIYEVCNTSEPPVCRKGSAFILVNSTGIQYIDLAGKDTTIGSCEPYLLQALQPDGTEFTYSWEPSDLLDNANSPNPVFTPGFSTTFKLTVSGNNGFTATDSVTITVSEINAEAGDDIFINPNSSAVLDGSSSYGHNLQYLWTTENGKIESGETTPRPEISKIGTYYLEVTDSYGCKSIDSVNVGMFTYSPVAMDDYDTTMYKTEVKIDVLANDSDPDNDLDNLSLTVTKTPFNGTAYVDNNDFTIRYRPNDNFSGSDNFEYEICDITDKCDRAFVFVMVTDFRFFIPDAFSPNSDNINDYFEIIGIEEYEGNSIEIFNRWGNKVYQATNYGINTTPKFWDGKSNTGFRMGNESLPSGTYFYVLTLGKGEKRIAGSVYLDR